MKATELIKALQHIVETTGDLDVDISVAKQPNAKLPDQQYLEAEARFVELEAYGNPKDPDEVRISIRDWPY